MIMITIEILDLLVNCSPHAGISSVIAELPHNLETGDSIQYPQCNGY